MNLYNTCDLDLVVSDNNTNLDAMDVLQYSDLDLVISNDNANLEETKSKVQCMHVVHKLFLDNFIAV